MLRNIIVALALCAATSAAARDNGQWANADPKVSEWYRSLMQPDDPSVSCCGTADAYYVDLHVKDGKTIAVIDDDRPDEPLGRPHVPNGTEIEVPPRKLKWDSGNPDPAGRAILFIGYARNVFCLVQSGGL